MTKYLATDEGARRAYEEWATAHEDLERLQSYGTELALGYAEVEEPREMRLGNLEPRMEARMETVRGRGDAA